MKSTALLFSMTSAKQIWPMPKTFESKGNDVLSLDPCAFEGLTASTSPFDKKILEYSKLMMPSLKCNGVSTRPVVTYDVADMTYAEPKPDTEESYSLEIDSTEIKIKTNTYVGFVRALESVSQLVSEDNQIQGLPLYVQDSPDFSYRGLMLDTSRHFFSKKSILRTLDAMMYNKLNVLHWHITDDVSFPIELESYPELAAKGAYSSSETYSKQDVLDVIERATSNGIRVIPELDTPGHVNSWGFNE